MRFVIASEFDSIGFGGNHGHGRHCLDHRQKAVGVNGLVGNDHTHVLHAFNEIRGVGDVVAFATAQTTSSQIAQAINGCMILWCSSPHENGQGVVARFLLWCSSPHENGQGVVARFLGAPAACWCARTSVLSRKTPEHRVPWLESRMAIAPG